MSIILLSKADEEYLEKCATQLNFTYGIIIGQRAEPDKYVIVHLAKNGEEDFDIYAGNDESSLNSGPQNVEEIDLQALTSQWSSAGRMIPGSFNVLGVFVSGISKDFVNDQSADFKSAKKLLYDVHNILKQSQQFAYTELPQNDYLYISYSSAMKKAVCKMYNYSANGGTFSPMEHRFVEKPFEWYAFECNYEMDDVFPIVEDFEKLNIEAHFQRTIELMQNYLKSSEIFLQNEIVDDNDILWQYIKQYHRYQEQNNSIPSESEALPDTKASTAAATTVTATTGTSSQRASGNAYSNDDYIKATILLPVKCVMSKHDNAIQVKEFKGTIRFYGTVTSRIWCNPKNTIGDVKRFIRTDIVRSLMARIQVYCDGLTESLINKEVMFISEPPRRIYFTVNFTANKHNSKSVQFSEYLFRGEAPTVVVAQAKQILDLDITAENIIADVEGIPEDDAFVDDNNDSLEFSTQHQKKLFDKESTRLEMTRSMYMIGIAVALLVLIISIAFQFIFN